MLSTFFFNLKANVGRRSLQFIQQSNGPGIVRVHYKTSTCNCGWITSVSIQIHKAQHDRTSSSTRSKSEIEACNNFLLSFGMIGSSGSFLSQEVLPMTDVRLMHKNEMSLLLFIAPKFLNVAKVFLYATSLH